MSITIKGVTSGGVDLKAPDTGSNTTVTLPSATGTLLPTDGNGSALTNLTSANLVGALPALSGANLTGLTSANLTGALPAISGASLTNLPSKGKNWIINGGMQISQRQDYTTATAITNGAYTLDRWKIKASAVTMTVQDTTNKLKMVATSSGTGTIGIKQLIENYSFFAGKTITVSAKVTSNNSNARLNIFDGSSTVSSSGHTGGGAEESLSVTVTLGAAITALHIRPHINLADGSSGSLSSGDYMEVSEVQLEVGSTATDFEHRRYSEELALCQRYFTIINNNSSYAGFANNANANFNVPLSVPLRSSPTASLSAGNKTVWRHNGSQDSTATAVTIAVFVTDANSIQLQVAGFSGNNDGYGLTFHTGQGFLSLDSEM